MGKPEIKKGREFRDGKAVAMKGRSNLAQIEAGAALDDRSRRKLISAVRNLYTHATPITALKQALELSGIQVDSDDSIPDFLKKVSAIPKAQGALFMYRAWLEHLHQIRGIETAPARKRAAAPRRKDLTKEMVAKFVSEYERQRAPRRCRTEAIEVCAETYGVDPKTVRNRLIEAK